MADETLILAIDQGTTSTRAMLFDADGGIRAQAQRELAQIFPSEGWVEHDAEEIWAATLAVCRDAIAAFGADAIAAIGITNQRETTVLWNRETGAPIHNAIVWQDRRTSDLCRALVETGHAETIRRKTGLVVDPYFSATKITWLLDHVEGARAHPNGDRAAHLQGRHRRVDLEIHNLIGEGKTPAAGFEADQFGLEQVHLWRADETGHE